MPVEVSDDTGRQYKIAEKLGKGGFAVCYRTEITGQQFALKVSRTNEMNEKLRDKLITELQIHSKVRHANIVQFHRAFSVQDNTYITLELCPNGTLKEMLANRGRISMPETRRFGLQLCGALHYLHSKRVIHRDIKTANILLDDQMNIKLADFGLAAVLVTDEEMGEVKRRVTVCGTPNYIAPEILHKKLGHDTKADIWSLGVLFFNMLTGCMPFSRPEDKGHDVVFKRVAEGSFNWPLHASKTISTAALELVNCMLQTVEVDRPESQEVANHEFFRLGLIPFKLEASCTRSRPTWLKKSDPQDMRLNAKTISHEMMLVACGLDERVIRPPLTEIGQEYDPTYSNHSNHKKPLSHLLLYEYNQGLVPTLPLRSVYEPVEYPNQGALKIKPRKAPLPIRTTTNRKDHTLSSTTSRTPEPETSPFIGPSDGVVLGNLNTDLKTTVTNVWNIMKGRTSDIRRTNSGLPPDVVLSLHTEKWGLGYVLVDGSIGLFSQRRAPEKAILMNNAIQHFKSYKDPKDAPTIPKNSPIFCYERDPRTTTSSEKTSLPTQVRFYVDSTEKYTCIESTSSTASNKYKLEYNGSDPYHGERSKTLSLWSRYATYLAGKARVQDLDLQGPSAPAEVYLSMWQMIGNVQAWHWIATSTSGGHGGFEFEFADRTKLALSADGTEVRFLYDADAVLNGDGPQATATGKLETLELSLAVLLSCSAKKNAMIWRLLQANFFKTKLDFIRDVLLMWLSNKGIGKDGSQKMAYRGPLIGMQSREDDVEVLRYLELIL